MSQKLQYCKILNTNINVTNMQDTLDYISEHLEELRGDYICVSNVHTTVTAFRDPRYQSVQNGGAMALPDGKPLSFVSRRRGYYSAQRVAGPDLMPEIFAMSLEKGYRHFFFGSREHTLKLLREKLEREYPGLIIAGMFAPPYYTCIDDIPPEEDEEAIRIINESKPDFIWVGLGAPKQEIWMANHKGKLNGVMIGVGAGFDFYTGTIKRAPRWMQEAYLEWLYRLIQDPERLMKRYVSTNVAFVVETCKEGRREKKRIRKSRAKIAMIGHKRIPSREGGVEIVVDELSTRMADKGLQVDAYNRFGYHVSGRQYTTKAQGRFYRGVRIFTIPTFHNGKLNAIVYSILASIRVLFGRYDVIHYHAEGPCIMLWLPHLFGIPCVATIHGLDWQRAKWGNFASRMLKLGEKTAATKADEVIVLSANIQQYFRDTYGIETHFIPNGIDRPVKQPVSMIREKYGLEKDGYILFLSRLVPEKGAHYLIEAYEKLHTDKKLVIAGGDSNAVEYVEQIRAAAAKDSRIIMTYFVQGRILEELYSNAYIFVQPSEVEGMALSVLEAMSYGNCCVVSDIRENTEVVEDYALTFAKSDPQDLAKVLQDLLDHPETVEKYRSRAADYICGRYQWDKVVEETLAVYRSAIKKHRKEGKADAHSDGQ